MGKKNDPSQLRVLCCAPYPMDTRPSHRPRYQLTRGLIALDNEKDAMTSLCLDRKEVRCTTFHSSGDTGRPFLAFGGPDKQLSIE